MPSTTETEPLPGFETPVRLMAEYVAETYEIIRESKARNRPGRTFLLLSGGNDSLVLLDAVAHMADEVVHINTGIGIEETNEFARKVGSSYGIPFTELHPPESYEDLVLDPDRWNGLPGPGAHQFSFSMLKERCIEELLRRHRTHRGERFILLAGARSAESTRRMSHSDVERRKGGQVWLNPLLHWPNQTMDNWRRTRKLPVNEVAANLHMSGECLCGAMASQGEAREERALIRFFYPEFDARLSALEAECVARDLKYQEWGVKRPKPVTQRQVEELDLEWSPMCSSCKGRQEVSQ